MMLPLDALQDKSGRLAAPWRQFFQTLAACAGGPAYEIELVRINDTSVKIRMIGSDKVARESAPIALT